MWGVTQSPVSTISRATSALRPSSGSPSPGWPRRKKKMGAHRARRRTTGRRAPAGASRGAGCGAAASGGLIGRGRIGAPRDGVNGGGLRWNPCTVIDVQRCDRGGATVLESAASTPCQGTGRNLNVRLPKMLRLWRKSQWLALVLALIALPSYRSGPFPDEKKADEKKADAKKPAKLDVNAVPENARKVEFTTDEGTWMSLDVSPDGKAILFDLLGDIYRVGIAGGKAERVTSGLAFDYAPRYSPDGRMIVFCSDRGGNMNLWLMNSDGTEARALTEEKDAIFSSPSWTPDGVYVLARREDTSKAGIPPVEIFMIHRDGGSGVKIIPKDKIDTSAGPIASPDGRYIYLTGRKADFSYTPNMTNGLWHVYRFDRKTGEIVQLTTAPDGGLRSEEHTSELQ